MKNALFSLILAILIPQLAKADLTPFEKSAPKWEITGTKPAPYLPAGTGQFAVTFADEDNKPMTDSMAVRHNQMWKFYYPNDKGIIYIGLKEGIYKFEFFCNGDYFTVYTDSILLKERTQVALTVRYFRAYYPVITEKPVIYFYPEKETQMNVQLSVNGSLGFTYPKYNKGWNFSADTNGVLSMNGNQYDYLFWDGEANINFSKLNMNEGAVIHRDSAAVFFERSLTAMGFTPRERQDFITYWCPQMQKTETSFIQFISQDVYDDAAPLSISPKPDNVNRVFMIWCDGARYSHAQLTPQKFTPLNREGFDVLEWGGAHFNPELIPALETTGLDFRNQH
jgi:hypothetical protein